MSLWPAFWRTLNIEYNRILISHWVKLSIDGVTCSANITRLRSTPARRNSPLPPSVHRVTPAETKPHKFPLSTNRGFFWTSSQLTARVPPPTAAVNVTLLVFAAERRAVGRPRCSFALYLLFISIHMCTMFSLSVLWRCWLGGRKGIRPVKNWVVGCWRGYLSGARSDLHMAQLMPLPLTVTSFSKIQIGFTFLVPAHLGRPGQRAVKRVCVYVCVCTMFSCV